MPITFSQIALLIRERKVRITAETLGYLMLAAAEQAADDQCWEPGTLTLEGAGSVTVNEAQTGQAPTELIPRMLGGMLSACSTENLALESCARVAPDSLAELRQQLRVALVPVNRGAARRALIRLHKDAAPHATSLAAGATGGCWLGDVPIRHEPVQPPRIGSPRLPPDPPTPLLGSRVAFVPPQEDDRTPLQLSPFVLHRDADLPPSPYLAEHVPLRSDVFDLLKTDGARRAG